MSSSTPRPPLPRIIGLGLGYAGPDHSTTDVPAPGHRRTSDTPFDFRATTGSSRLADFSLGFNQSLSRESTAEVNRSRNLHPRNRHGSMMSLVEFSPPLEAVDLGYIYRESTLSPEIDDAQWERIRSTMPTDDQPSRLGSRYLPPRPTSLFMPDLGDRSSPQPATSNPALRAIENPSQNERAQGSLRRVRGNISTSDIRRNRHSNHAPPRNWWPDNDDISMAILRPLMSEFSSGTSDGEEYEDMEHRNNTFVSNAERTARRNIQQSDEYDGAMHALTFIMLNGRPTSQEDDFRNSSTPTLMSDDQMEDDEEIVMNDFWRGFADRGL
ncbi:hypothetical protein Cpir12675_006897 [Ceratocystis pirilliformis]|uniref:Uncharacterized protein n=1 Tax=Ceratocystis pirilliformis TaxID=259994 RepID=A0ABR3YE10_9PEZI